MVQLVVSFDTTEDAIKTEELCKAKGIPGRIIPVPPDIDASCGLAWRTDLCNRAWMEQCLLQASVKGHFHERAFRF